MSLFTMLAGYITATTVDLALASRSNSNLRLRNHASYTNSDYSDLDSILNNYIGRLDQKIQTAVLGVAGPVIDNVVITTNIPWKISGDELAEKFSLNRVRLVNDLATTAHGLFELKHEKFFTINEGIKKRGGNIALIAAGTGLGEALIHWEDDQLCHYASEGGHAGFAPGNQIESELWQYLYAELGNVETEDVVSLRGIERIYRFLTESQGYPSAEWYEQVDDRPSRVIEAALAGSDDTAVRAIDIFIDCYAAEAANLAMVGVSLGGVYLGGRIAPEIMTLLDTGRFMERFVKKGKLSGLLTRMPVALIIEDRTALIGAAVMALESETEQP